VLPNAFFFYTQTENNTQDRDEIVIMRFCCKFFLFLCHEKFDLLLVIMMVYTNNNSRLCRGWIKSCYTNNSPTKSLSLPKGNTISVTIKRDKFENQVKITHFRSSRALTYLRSSGWVIIITL